MGRITYDGESIIFMLIMGVVIIIIAIMVSADVVNERWKEWHDCTLNETTVKVVDCDEHYKAPFD